MSNRIGYEDLCFAFFVGAGFGWLLGYFIWAAQ